jgi:hypothetical protein
MRPDEPAREFISVSREGVTMFRWKKSGVVAVLIVMGLVCAGVAFAQRGEGQRGGGAGERRGRPAQRGGRPGERGRFDPEQIRQMILQRMQEMLGATDEEWTVIGPRLEKVMELSRQAQGGLGARMFRGMRRRPGGEERGREGPGRGREEQEQSAVEKAADALQQALSEEGSSPAEIKARLTRYRQAREQARQELAKAQEELRNVLTVRQEAQLVLMGQLD